MVEFTPEQIKQVRFLSTTEGFVEAFEANLSECRTNSMAYELVEREHEHLFGRRKYSCYYSFATHAVRKTREKRKGR